jgi:hypothetical protein
LLILLSSGARRRYRDDIVRALAHPAGTELRFRYGKAYVADAVLTDHQRGTLAGQEALICHLADQPGGKPALLVPCRFVKVSRAELVGSSLILTLTAGEYAQQLDDGALRALMSDEERALLPNQSSDAAAPVGKFAFPIAAPLTAKHAPDAASGSAFEATAEVLRAVGFGAHEPMAFYMVRKLIATGTRLGDDDVAIAASEGRYALFSGKRYALDVYSYAPDGDTKPSDASTLTVEADDSDVKFSSETAAKLDSRYDMNRFRFSTEHRLLALPTGLRVALGVPRTIDGKSVVEKRCDITLELRFAGAAWLTVARVGLIAIGTAGPAIIGAYAAQKGSLGLAVIMVMVALATGIGTILKKN